MQQNIFVHSCWPFESVLSAFVFCLPYCFSLVECVPFQHAADAIVVCFWVQVRQWNDIMYFVVTMKLSSVSFILFVVIFVPPFSHRESWCNEQGANKFAAPEQNDSKQNTEKKRKNKSKQMKWNGFCSCFVASFGVFGCADCVNAISLNPPDWRMANGCICPNANRLAITF